MTLEWHQNDLFFHFFAISDQFDDDTEMTLKWHYNDTKMTLKWHLFFHFGAISDVFDDDTKLRRKCLPPGGRERLVGGAYGFMDIKYVDGPDDGWLRLPRAAIGPLEFWYRNELFQRFFSGILQHCQR